MKRGMKRQRGQAMVEYIIIVVIVAIAALVVMGSFSNRIRTMIAGATVSLGGEAPEVNDSLDELRGLGDGGITE
jgi:Flp pilus assembly pilin Flp